MEHERPLGGYIRALANALGQDMRQRADAQGLTPTQGMFLHHLWRRKTIQGLETYPRDLEEFFNIKHSTVSGILQRMEAAGFVALEESPTDRRCKVITLTPKALAAHDDTHQGILMSEARLVEGMTAKEAREFRRLLVLAAENLDVCHVPAQPPIDPKEDNHL